MLPRPSYAGEHWYQLLQGAVASQGIAPVAKLLGYRNHTSTSLVLRGKYPGGTAQFAQRVLKVLDRVSCPHLGRVITQTDCRSFALHDNPTSSTAAADQWRACRRCPKRPTEDAACKRN